MITQKVVHIKTSFQEHNTVNHLAGPYNGPTCNIMNVSFLPGSSYIRQSEFILARANSRHGQ